LTLTEIDIIEVFSDIVKYYLAGLLYWLDFNLAMAVFLYGGDGWEAASCCGIEWGINRV
jgi:hypothetical protein